MKYRYFDNAEEIKDNVKRHAIRGATATILTRVLSYVIQTVGTMILARLLVPEDFGLVAMVTVISNIAVEFGTLRLSDAIIQKDSIFHDQVSTLFWVNMLLCTLIALIFMISSPILSFIYKEPRVQLIAIIISTSFVFSGLSNIHMALMQRNMQFIPLAIMQIATLALTDVMAVAMAMKGYGYWAIVGRRIGQSIFLAACVWVWFRWTPGLPVRNCGVVPMVKYGVNSLFSYTANHFTRTLDKMLIGWKNGAVPLAHYERAYFLFVMPVNQITYPLTSVAVATLSRLLDTPDRFRNYYYKSIFSLAMVGMPLSALLTVMGKDVIRILLGPKWGTAGIVFSVFAPSIGVMLVYATNTWLHLAIGRADLLFRWGMISFIVTALALSIGVMFGPVYVAAAYSVSFYILLFPGLWYAGKGIDIQNSKVLSIIYRPFVASLASGIMTYLLANKITIEIVNNVEINLIIKSAIVCIAFIPLYVVAIIFMYGSLDPFNQLIDLLKENLNKKK